MAQRGPLLTPSRRSSLCVRFSDRPFRGPTRFLPGPFNGFIAPVRLLLRRHGLVDRDFLNAIDPERMRGGCGEVDATTLHKGPTVVNPYSDAAPALLRRDGGLRTEWSAAMSSRHGAGVHSFAGCSFAAAVAVARRNASFGRCRRGDDTNQSSGAHAPKAVHRLNSRSRPDRKTTQWRVCSTIG